MIAFIRHTLGLGNTAIYARLRNATGQYWDFVGGGTPAWVANINANCKSFLTEYADSDPTTSYYSASITIPTDNVYSVEVVLDSTSAVLGYESTKDAVLLVDAPNATAITAIQTSIKGITIADADTLGANTWLLWLRRVKWMITNKLAVVDANGNYTLYKDDGTTSAATGSITDDSTTTTRSTPTWA